VLPDELVAFLYTDLAGVLRGRSVRAADAERRLPTGLGWVPANQSLTVFGAIAEPNPFGAVGDLRIVPDPATRVRVEPGDGVPPLHFYLCDAVETDGSPWPACPRTFLRTVLDDLRRETGLRLVAAFEHEFQVLDGAAPEAPFSLAAQRAADPFGPLLVAALQEAGCEPETFLPEYGPHQYEIVTGPVEGVAAADRSVVVKALVREVARLLGRRVTFAPLIDPGGVGNGAHIHLSFVDESGGPATYDPERPGGVSARAGSFAAGILRQLPALTALTSPSAISFLRLTAHRWSAGAACLGERNRETALRIAPVVEMAGQDPSRSFNLEYRPADGAASPYVALAGLVLAGLEGLREGLPAPPVLDRDPSSLDEDELALFLGPPPPRSLPDALDALERDPVLGRGLPPLLLETYVGMKRAEHALVADLDPVEACARYVAVL
jgi:glutamine synthetase